MKIFLTEVAEVKKRIDVFVTYKSKDFYLTITTINGIVQGDAHNGVKTSNLAYFNDTPFHIRERHFKRIKKYIEEKYK